MKHGLIIALMALTGCATLERHPYITGFVVTSLVITGAKALDGRRDLTRTGDMPPICRTNPSSCK